MDLKHSSATHLDIDESILSRTLKINNDEDEFQQLLSAALIDRKIISKDGVLPYKLVKPKPGFCVKTKNLVTSQKVFLNICHTDVIPQPVEVTESELTRILESDEPSTFRVPMSLGEGHDEVDKSGSSCIAYDIAINSLFLSKLEGSLLFQTFVVTAAMEGLEDKYNMELDKNGWTILKNRKCFGSIRNHKIEQREEKPFVQEIPKPSQLDDGSKVHPLIEEVIATKPTLQHKAPPVPSVPKFALSSSKSGVGFVMATIPIPSDENENNVSLSAGEDTITVKGLNDHCICDVKLPHRIDPLKSKGIFNKQSRMLTVLLPLK